MASAIWYRVVALLEYIITGMLTLESDGKIYEEGRTKLVIIYMCSTARTSWIRIEYMYRQF